MVANSQQRFSVAEPENVDLDRCASPGQIASTLADLEAPTPQEPIPYANSLRAYPHDAAPFTSIAKGSASAEGRDDEHGLFPPQEAAPVPQGEHDIQLNGRWSHHEAGLLPIGRIVEPDPNSIAVRRPRRSVTIDPRVQEAIRTSKRGTYRRNK